MILHPHNCKLISEVIVYDSKNYIATYTHAVEMCALVKQLCMSNCLRSSKSSPSSQSIVCIILRSVNHLLPS